MRYGWNGKNCFKMTLYICIVLKPYSKLNMNFITMVPDTATNIGIIMEDSKPQIKRLTPLSCGERKELKFLSPMTIGFWLTFTVYQGHLSSFHVSGARKKAKNAIPSSWKCTRKIIAVPCKKKFLLTGCDIKKHYFNVVHQTMSDIDIHHIFFPYSHILLALVWVASWADGVGCYSDRGESRRGESQVIRRD